jgi:hypothetical protein
MTPRTKDKTQQRSVDSGEFLRATPRTNEAMEVSPLRDGGALAKIPMRRPRWFVPPISWVLPFSSHRRIRLDAVGADVLNLCDGTNRVETVIEKFAAANKLSFREAQLPVTQFLQQLTERGLVAIVGSPNEANEQ